MMRKRRKSLVRVARILRQRRIIARCSYYDYMSLILTAETPDQLEEIAIDFAELCCFNQSWQDNRVREKEEDTIPNRPAVLVMRDEVPPIRRDTKAWEEPGVFVDLWI
jgi:hypothetical protein